MVYIDVLLITRFLSNYHIPIKIYWLFQCKKNYNKDYDISKLYYYNNYLDDKNKYATTISLDAGDAIIYNYIDMIEKISIQSLKTFDVGGICFIMVYIWR